MQQLTATLKCARYLHWRESSGILRVLSVKARALSRLNRVAEAKQTAAAALTLLGERQIADAIQIAGLKRLAATGQGY